MVARRQLKASYGSSGSNNIAQSHVIEHQLRENPIYVRSGAPADQPTHLDHCNTVRQHHHHHHHNPPPPSSATATHSYEKLDHVIINPPAISSASNPTYNLLTIATPTTANPEVINTMGYLVAARDPARPIIIWAPRSRDAANNMAELNVVTDQHGGAGRPCCCTTSVSGLPSTATSGGGGGGYMECDAARARSAHVIGGDESRERQHVTLGAESRVRDNNFILSRDQNTMHRFKGNDQYTSMSHSHGRLNDWNISAL